MNLEKIPSPVEGTTRYLFVHEGRTGVVAGSRSYWLAGWVSPKREQFSSVVKGTSRERAIAALVSGAHSEAPEPPRLVTS